MDFFNAFTWFMRSSAFAHVLFLAGMLFCIKLKRRKLFWVRFIPTALIYNALPYLIPGSYTTPYLTAGWFSFSYLIFVLLLGGIMLLCFDIKIIEAVFYVTCAYAVQNAALHLDLLYQLVVSRVSGGVVFSFVYAMFSLIANAGMLLILYFFIVKSVRATLNQHCRSRILIISVVIILVVYVLDMWTRHYRMENIGTHIYAIISCALLIAAQCGIFRESGFEREQAILSELLKIESKQRRLGEENTAAMNVKFHDLKQRLEAAALTGNTEREYAELKKLVDVYDSFLKSGNDVLDVVLTEKSLICKNKDIRLSVIAEGEALAFMESADVGSLFGNILNNAIEAVENLEEQKRFISLNISKRRGFLSVHEDNSCNETPEFVNGLPQTTKGNSDFHGFGIKSIKMITEKYGGELSLGFSGGIFVLDILFPV